MHKRAVRLNVGPALVDALISQKDEREPPRAGLSATWRPACLQGLGGVSAGLRTLTETGDVRTACTPSSPECLTRPERTWRTFCGVCSCEHPGGRLLTELTRAEGRGAEPAAPRPQTQAEARGRAGRGPHPVLDTHMEAGLHPRLSRMLPAGKDVPGPQEQPPFHKSGLPASRCWRGPQALLYMVASSDGHFRPREGSRLSPHRTPTLPQCPSPSGPGSALGTALGPPASKPGRWVLGLSAAWSQGRGRKQAAGCGQAGSRSPVKEDGHALHRHDHGLAVGGRGAGLGRSARTDFLLPWNRAVSCRWFVKLDGSGKGA